MAYFEVPPLQLFEFLVEFQPGAQPNSVDDSLIVLLQTVDDLLIVGAGSVDRSNQLIQIPLAHVHNNPKTYKSEGVDLTIVDVQKAVGILLLLVDLLEVHVVHQQHVPVVHEH